MLIVTIHDVAPPMLGAAIELRELARQCGATRATLLAVPNFHGCARLAAHAPTVSWLRRCADAGDEVALHGIEHRQVAPASRCGALRARLMTAGEGEMLGAGAAAPGLLEAARDELAELVRGPIRGFVAPAWLEPPRFGALLARIGFSWHETALAIEHLAERSDAVRTMAAGDQPPDRLAERRRLVSPVVGFATRTQVRAGASLVWAAVTVPVLARLAMPARIALHPGDLSNPRVIAAAAKSIRRLARVHRAVTTATALELAGVAA